MAGKLAKKTPAIVDAFDKGTAKTRQRLKRESTLDRMMRERRRAGHRDTPDLERAAKEIEQVYFALTRRLFARTSGMEKIDRSEPPPPPEWLVNAYINRYIPWAKAAKELKSQVLVIIIDVVIEDRSLRDIERQRKLHKGFARQITIAGLKLYSNMARGDRKQDRLRYAPGA